MAGRSSSPVSPSQEPAMRRLLAPAALLLMLLPLAATADDKAKSDAPKGDLARFQGKWATKVGPEKNIEAVLTIEGQGATFAFTGPEGRSVEFKGEIKIDEQAKPHKTVDWVKFVRPNGEDAPENLGLYEF